MKRKIIILLSLAVLLMTTASYAEAVGNTANNVVALEKADVSDATVTASVLNVRQGPSLSYAAICKLQLGQSVKVLGKLGSWYAIYNTNDGCIGAVDGKYLKLGAAAVPASTKDAGSVSKAGSSETASNTSDTALANPSDLSKDETALLNLVNKARKDAGVNELAIDQNLEKIARLKAEDMVDNNYFSHQSPTYGSPFDMMKQFDNNFKSAGENIAGNKTVEGAFKAWMSSDTHKKNILNESFSVTGIGVVSSSTYGKVLVQQFIGR